MGRVKVMIKKQLTLTTLTSYLNEAFDKKTGGIFTPNDVQKYISRGCLPKYLGDYNIIKDKSIKGVKLYKIIRR